MKAVIVNAAVFQIGWLFCVLGGVQIPVFTTAMAALALGWALFMPVLIYLSACLDGVNQLTSGSLAQECDARV